MASAKEQMVKHVHHVLQPSCDLGVLDFLALAVAKKLTCFLYIGRGKTDWRAVFGQCLDKLPASAGDCHVVGTYSDGGVSLFSGTVSNGFPSCHYGFLPDGLVPVATRTVDCGLDAWAHALGVHRSPEVYLSLRMDLAMFFLEHIDDPAWHNIWKTLGWTGCVVLPGGGSGTSGGNGGVVAAAEVSTMAGLPWLQTMVAGSGSGGSSGGVDHGGGALHVGGSGAGCSGAGGSGAGGSGAGGQPAAKAKARPRQRPRLLIKGKPARGSAARQGQPAAQASGKGKTASAKASGNVKTASAKASGKSKTASAKASEQY